MKNKTLHQYLVGTFAAALLVFNIAASIHDVEHQLEGELADCHIGFHISGKGDHGFGNISTLSFFKPTLEVAFSLPKPHYHVSNFRKLRYNPRSPPFSL